MPKRNGKHQDIKTAADELNNRIKKLFEAEMGDIPSDLSAEEWVEQEVDVIKEQLKILTHYPLDIVNNLLVLEDEDGNKLTDLNGTSLDLSNNKDLPPQP